MSLTLFLPHRGLPLITSSPRGRGWGQAFCTFPLRITCKKKKGGGVEGVQKACKIAYVINGRPHTRQSIRSISVWAQYIEDWYLPLRAHTHKIYF